MDKFIENGVLMDDGIRCVTKGAIGVSELIKITEEEKIELENNYDPIEAPPGPYKVQPAIQGLEFRSSFAFIFFSSLYKVYVILRKNSLVFWCPGNGKINNSPNTGERGRLRLL